ncbi:MAG TPA: phosphoesterase [Cryomorphaceae bacterium]|nr:phosphoesterase [Owenweeksia sp.]MBF99887.1 phosphoesterase [Owenweeksia sp.]HAD97563.1 phosphoesterase [Cryomorphaceae bacterium]HBF21262.1 phosphoesterase [Cryomorphaceae bacterium]
MLLDKRPLILTLKLNPEAELFFNKLREEYFPPERNYLKAHLTLFHALPGEQLSEIQSGLKEIAGKTIPFQLKPESWKAIGKGVAFILDCPELISLHQQLQSRWTSHLTRQDAQKLWPQITIQNKVSLEEARITMDKIKDLRPPPIQGIGFNLFYYDNGPWEFIESYFFP